MKQHSKKECDEDIVTLRDYVDEKFNALEKATTLASENLKVRLDSLNEWRLQNKEEREQFVTRKEFEVRLETIDKGRRDNLALWISLGAILVSVIFRFWK